MILLCRHFLLSAVVGPCGNQAAAAIRGGKKLNQKFSYLVSISPKVVREIYLTFSYIRDVYDKPCSARPGAD